MSRKVWTTSTVTMYRGHLGKLPLYPDQLVEGSLESLVFVPVVDDVGIGRNIEDVLDGEDREHGQVHLGGGLRVVQHRGVLPVAGYEPPAHHRAVDHHHHPAERQKQHQGRVFITGTI